MSQADNRETELKLILPEQAVPALLADPFLAGRNPRRALLQNTYYDTPDLALHRLRIALRLRRKEEKNAGKWLLTVKSAAAATGGFSVRGEWETAFPWRKKTAPSSLAGCSFAHIDDEALRDRLEALREQLCPVFTTHFERTAWLIDDCMDGIDDGNRSRVELALDQGSIESGNARQPICEVELELLAGSPLALFEIAGLLQQRHPLHPFQPSKAERAYALYSSVAPKPVRASQYQYINPIEAGQTATTPAAFACIASACLAHLQSNESGVQAGIESGNESGNPEIDPDPEFIHQARVALRRLHSALQCFKPTLPENFVDHFIPLWRKQLRALAPARDWDVVTLNLWPHIRNELSGEQAEAWLQKLQEKRRQARRKAARAFNDPAYSRLLIEFMAELLKLPVSDGAAHPGNEQNDLKTFAAARLEKISRQVNVRCKRIEKTGVDTRTLHKLRLKLKKLRYSLEFFAPLFPENDRQPFQQALSDMQKVLGDLNDLDTARRLLARLEKTGKMKGSATIRHHLKQRQNKLLKELPGQLKQLREQNRTFFKRRDSAKNPDAKTSR